MNSLRVGVIAPIEGGEEVDCDSILLRRVSGGWHRPLGGLAEHVVAPGDRHHRRGSRGDGGGVVVRELLPQTVLHVLVR